MAGGIHRVEAGDECLLHRVPDQDRVFVICSGAENWVALLQSQIRFKTVAGLPSCRSSFARVESCDGRLLHCLTPICWGQNVPKIPQNTACGYRVEAGDERLLDRVPDQDRVFVVQREDRVGRLEVLNVTDRADVPGVGLRV